MPSRAAAAKLPQAYEEDLRAKPRPSAVPEHFISLEHAEPSPIMLGFQKGWRRFVGFLKLSAILAVIGAYPAATVLSSHVDDSAVVIPGDQSWSVSVVGVAIHKIARELAGAGWAADRPGWHPQARLTALPAWQEATASGLSDHTLLLAEVAANAEGPDGDLAAASRLLKAVPGEDMRPRLTAAAEALNRFDTRASRGLAVRPSPEETLPREMALFADWAAEDRGALSDRINAEQSAWPASKEDISAFYAAKARAHLAHQLVVAGKARAYGLTGDTEVAVALSSAETAWKRAADMKPVFVSNQSGSAALMPNHLASMAFYLFEAEEASRRLADRLAPPPAVIEEVAAIAQTGEAVPVP
ncbi:MAG: hypothetical protein FP825_07450 [Hyphomonas sp.]|uniref:hypothetical protein n=1 Tax=Hyphomonas sp. TaxID=87 RepID=UPI0018476DBA|nr:hypothetical protein [Hyphomonas sp.]MBA3068297.1 hypothetical protein [Hyphomonas sp.]MBU4060837.1 hypothetical protein [Alphaproteobacteria bacterium]MBU4164821.1 hypothetical protein [Alphaproteobacteria bacterium]